MPIIQLKRKLIAWHVLSMLQQWKSWVTLYVQFGSTETKLISVESTRQDNVKQCQAG